MNLSAEQLSELEEMAGLFFSIEDISDNLEVDSEELEKLISLKSGEIYKTYKRGWLKGDITLRKSIAKAAENGSNPAQQMMLNFQKNK
jgi:hypothetical protein